MATMLGRHGLLRATAFASCSRRCNAQRIRLMEASRSMHALPQTSTPGFKVPSSTLPNKWCRKPQMLLINNEHYAQKQSIVNFVPTRLLSGSLDSLNVMKSEAEDSVYAQKLYAQGFLVSGVHYAGPVLLTNNKVFHWNVEGLSAEQISTDCVSIVKVLDPTPEVLILGTGSRTVLPHSDLVSDLKRLGITLEAMDSLNAMGTFNCLAEEGRPVVAALLTPSQSQ